MRNKTSSNTWLPRKHFTPEETWWVADAWDEHTMDLLLEASDRPERPYLRLEEQLCAVLEYNSRVNLDGMLPTGAWVVTLLQKIGDRRIGLDSKSTLVASQFPEWRKYPELSEPVRLYAYYREELPDTTDHACRLLLRCAELTDVDIDFLLGGIQGRPTGRKSREEVISGFSKDAAALKVGERDLLYAAPSVYDGFLCRRHLYLLLTNHSFADSPRFDEVILQIERWRNEPALHGASFGEELFLFLQAALNPATNHSTLALIQSFTRREEEWMKCLASQRSRDSSYEEMQDAKSRIYEAALKASSRLDYENREEDMRHEAEIVHALVNALPQHPNWVQTEEDFEPEGFNTYTVLLSSLTAGFFEDAASEDDKNLAFDYLYRKVGDGSQFWEEARVLYPFTDSVRRRAREVILNPLDYSLKEVCSYAHIAESVLRPLREMEAALGETAGRIPRDWLLEIIG